MTDDEQAAPELSEQGASAGAETAPSEELQVVEEPKLEEIADEEVEYEYVYEDEHGNPIAAPHGEIDPEHYEEEVIKVIEDGEEDAAAAAGPADPGAVTVNLSPEERGRQVRSGSTRRVSDRRTSRRRTGRPSGRLSSRQLDPEEAMKHAKLKTILMVGSILSIPVLIVLILIMCYVKGRWPFSPRKTKTVMVKNDYEKGRDLASQAFRDFQRARKLEGRDDAYHAALKKCESKYDRAIRLMGRWREKNRGEGYWFVDQRIQDANIKLNVIRNEIFKIDMRRSRVN
jgi:hypothetical protein